MAKTQRGSSVSKSRQRKIDHIRSLSGKEGWPKPRIRDKGLHHMKMKSEDLQIALDGTIY